MIRHVVIWKLRGPSEAERRAQAKDVARALVGLRGNIPGMTALEVGLGSGAAAEEGDVVLMTTHDSWDALRAYQQHPAHQEVARLIGELRVDRRVVDFEA